MRSPERFAIEDPAAWWAAWMRAWGLRAPMSGDVNQDIDTSLIRSVGDQVGFININTSRSADPQLERHIVSRVGVTVRVRSPRPERLKGALRHFHLDAARTGGTLHVRHADGERASNP